LSDTTDLKSGDTGAAAPTGEAASAATGSVRRRRTGTGLSAMLLSELQGLAASLGISGTGRMRKGELIAAIQEKQAAGPKSSESRVPGPRQAEATAAAQDAPAPPAAAAEQQTLPGTAAEPPTRGGRASRAGGPPPEPATRPTSTANGRATGAAEGAGPDTATAERAGSERSRSDSAHGDRAGQRADSERAGDGDRGDRAERSERSGDGERGDRAERGDRGRGNDARGESDRGDRGDRNSRSNDRDRDDRGDRGDRGDRNRGGDARGDGDRGERSDRGDRGDRGDRADRNRGGNDRGNDRDGGGHNDEDDGEGGRRSRRSRFRDRRRGGNRNERGEGGGGGGNEPAVNDDDVLLPVAGIVDVLDNYAFIRTSGYLAGANDVYVSMSQVRKYGLRRGDAVTGAVRAPREGEQRRDKYNPLVRLDAINGMDPEESKRRPEFYKLTPLYPQDRLRLETEPNVFTTRIIDLIAPIGKGQRALIVSPPKAGKTMVLQAIANGITTNNPEALLMVVLVDERPEEVTDMQRSVKGEVIAATFDRPPSDHTTLAELSIERAKRMVELGHDVVVLLDSITRLGRSYNLAAPASGRIMSGGIDSTALYPPKRFLGAARNIENGGSLTIIATALVETGSAMDTVIFEEFKGTGNSELKLDRKIADKRVFPAVDVNLSSTRKEEILMGADELAIVHKLRRVLHALDPQQALDLLLDRMKKTKTNVEFLMQIKTSTPG
jgi:transcription termination factor Rho